MEDVIEWRRDYSISEVECLRIVLKFEGKEYLLGSAGKFFSKKGRRFHWEIAWRNELFNFMDGGFFILKAGAPLEPYQKKMNAYIITNLWRIVRRLKEIEGERGNQA